MAVDHASETWPICHSKVAFLLWRQTFTGEFVEALIHILGSEHGIRLCVFLFSPSFGILLWETLNRKRPCEGMLSSPVCVVISLFYSARGLYSYLVLKHFHCNCLTGMDQLQTLLLSDQKLELGVRGDRLQPMTPQNHALTQLIIRCLHSNPKKRPSAEGELSIFY